MTPEEAQKLRQDVEHLQARLNAIENASRLIFAKDIEIPREIGIKIGLNSKSKFAFWGVTPVIQQSAISKPTGGVTQDAESRAAINSIIDALHAVGIIA